MIEPQFFGIIPTNEDLNGPILSIVQNPVDITTNTGSAQFVGIATAVFPQQSPSNPASNSGRLAYQWYEVGKGSLTDSANIIGSATTTLTLLNLQNPTDNGRQFYFIVDYVDSGIGTPTPSPGMARTTGTPNAINEPLKSNTVSLNIRPTISIIQQPTSLTTSTNTFVKFNVDATSTNLNQGGISYQWQLNGNNLVDGPNVRGSTTKELTISSSSVGNNTIRAVVSQPNAINSPLFSNSVSFNIIDPRPVLNVEIYPTNNIGNAVVYSWNLQTQGQLRFSNANPQVICFYPPEKDIDVYVYMYAGAGKSNGSFSGGSGGQSVIRLTLSKNTEYIFSNFIDSTQSGGSIFFYRKGSLVASVGGGGDAGTAGPGGNGGGVNVAGANGSGRGAGTGGSLFSPGTLPQNGIYGSLASLTGQSNTLKPGDSAAASPNGGRTLPCPKGYWFDRGFAPCADVGNVQYFPSSTPIPNSAVILRGFKSGYGIRNTAGLGINGGGNGGNGATGGNGGNGGGGGGGGSGYHDGSVTVVSTQQGGSTDSGYFIITTEPPAPTTINLTASTNSINIGQSVTLRWSSTNATSVVSSNFGATSVNGSVTVTPSSSTTYTITVSGPGGNNTSSVYVNVGIPSPSVSLSSNKQFVDLGSSAVLTWSSTNATSVVSSNFGATSVNGSVTVSPAAPTTYTITVSGPGGNASSNVTIPVRLPPSTPTLTLTASPSQISPGGSSILTWSSTNATSVVSSNFGATSVNGSVTVRPSSSTFYEITVSGLGGNMTNRVFVEVVCSTIIRTSIYGIGFQGYLKYGNGKTEPATNGSDLFITGVNSSYDGRSVSNAGGVTTTYNQIVSTIISAYQTYIRRYPESLGFDYWMRDFLTNPSYTSLSALTNTIRLGYTASGEQAYQIANGGLIGNYDNCNIKRL